jgi:hypothetical protein
LVAYTEGGNRLRVFENRVLRKIFGPKKEKISREWRGLRKGELCDLCSSPLILNAVYIPCSVFLLSTAHSILRPYMFPLRVVVIVTELM